MRILLSKKSREDLFKFLIRYYNCNSLKTLSIELKIPFKRLQDWRYNSVRYIPEKIIPAELKCRLELLDKQEDNWGKRLGGKKTYKIIIERYGKEEIRRRQSLGGKKSAGNLRRIISEFDIDIKNHYFLEFYGALLGDGWLSQFKVKNKTISLIGVSGHMLLDKEYHLYLQKISTDVFLRKGYIKEKPKYNARELQIGHKTLLSFLNKKLNFPIGKKKNLVLPKEIFELGFNFTKWVIRGIFDTDGSFFLDKTPVGRPYPIISIHMRAPLLIHQIKEILLKEGFKPLIYHNGEELKLKGTIQLRKWMNEIGSSNPKHLNKINALVAQLDSATAS